jgi:hypothetical protein
MKGSSAWAKGERRRRVERRRRGKEVGLLLRIMPLLFATKGRLVRVWVWSAV